MKDTRIRPGRSAASLFRGGEPPYERERPATDAWDAELAERIVRRGPSVRPWLALAVVVLYVAACALPAVGRSPGIIALLWGWIPPFFIPWSANFLLVLGWAFLLAGEDATAARVGASASLLALTSWIWFLTEADFRPGPGYFCWQASMALLCLAPALTSASRSRRPR